MNFVRSLQSAIIASNRGAKRNKADVADAQAQSYSEREDVAAELEVVTDGGKEDPDTRQKHVFSVTGAFLTPRTRSPSPSRSPSHVGSHQFTEVPPSEYLLEPQKSAKWIPSTTHKLRHSRTCFITAVVITMISLTIILATVLMLTHHTHAAPKKAPEINFTVDLGYSKYTGVAATDSKIVKWLGIRYAAPPIGDLRFKAPQAPLVNDQVQVADKYGNVCLSTPSTSIATGLSEDCLFLNIYAPVDNTKTRPVFVFIQGGGFNGDSSPNLDGSPLIEAGDHDMIVVDFNYRVGPWGFLASKEVKADGDLNAGLLDQRLVLQWIQEYIHLFGGDPKRVTIGGASAGAASVTLHLSAYGGRNDGFFQAAAAESQSFGSQLTVEESQYQYDALVDRVGCNTTTDTLQCIRNLDTNVIAEHNSLIPTPGGAGGNPVFMYSDVIDGDLIQDYTYNLFATGRFIKVATIFGADTNDGTVFTPKNPMNNFTDVNNFLKDNFPKLTALELTEINSLYPKAQTFPNAGPYWRTAANAYGDMRYMCPGIWLSTIYDKHGARGWNYHWDVAPKSNIESGLGVTHCDELNSIWGTATEEPEVTLNPMIQAYWASFIRTGNPNTLKLSSAPVWEKMDSVGLQRVHFVDDPSHVSMEAVSADSNRQCSYLTTIGGPLGQ